MAFWPGGRQKEGQVEHPKGNGKGKRKRWKKQKEQKKQKNATPEGARNRQVWRTAAESQ